MVVLWLGLWLLLGCDYKGRLITLDSNKKFPSGWMDWSVNIWSLLPSTDQLKHSQDQLSDEWSAGTWGGNYQILKRIYFLCILSHHHNGNKRISSNHEQSTYES